MIRRLATVLLPLVLVATSIFVPATAQATGLTPWASSGNGTVQTVDDGSGSGPAEFTYFFNNATVYGDPVASGGTWVFSTTATAAGSVPLDYAWSGFHAWFDVTAELDAFVVKGIGNNSQDAPAYDTALFAEGPHNSNQGPPSGGFTYCGSQVFNVETGDTYGFRLKGSNYDSNNVLQGTFALDTGMGCPPPTPSPSPDPTADPTAEPTPPVDPTSDPTAEPTPGTDPTAEPTSTPTPSGDPQQSNIFMIVVNSADDHSDGTCGEADCTLREAIEWANANPPVDGAYGVAFDITSGSPRIELHTPLPKIVAAVGIDGMTQGGGACPSDGGSPAVELVAAENFDPGILNGGLTFGIGDNYSSTSAAAG